MMSRLSALQHADVRVAVGVLQPAVVPDGHHAEHGEEERAAAGQDVAGVRGHQEEQGGGHRAAQGGRLHPRPLHGGGQVDIYMVL